MNRLVSFVRPASFAYKSVLSNEPRGLKQARSSQDSPAWEAAYNAEIGNFLDGNGVKWVPRDEAPKEVRALPIEVVYTKIIDENGNLTRYKVRVTIRGDLQIANKHYNPNELSSPVASKDAIRVALAFTAAHYLHAEHIDI